MLKFLVHFGQGAVNLTYMGPCKLCHLFWIEGAGVRFLPQVAYDIVS